MTNATTHLTLILLFCCAASALVAVPEPNSNTLPIRTIGGYLMIVSVSVDDQGPFDFLVDTGTNTTLIDPALATELRLKPSDRLQLSSLGNSVTVTRYFLSKFKAGPAAISGLEALAVPLPQLSSLDPEIRGVLGMNFLLHFSFRLDYDRHALELYPFPEMATVPPGLRVPVEINESRLLIKIESRASPGGSWKLALDSGISQFLVFQDRILAGAAFCQESSCLMQVSTNLGQQSASTLLLHDVSIAEAQLPDTQVIVMRNDLEKPSDPQDGLLPAARFHSVFFDRSNASVVFSPSPGIVSLAGMQPR